ncbi:MAG: hydantoinase B/oxoprolinase family protein [Alcaligenaceae bacterium]
MKRIDPILIEVMKNELISIGEDMGITLKRTARSLAAQTGDFSTSITDEEGRILAQGFAIGLQIGYVKGVMPQVLEKFSGKLQPGDILVSNDPYGGASHLPDLILIAPIFWDKEVAGYVVVVLHHSDIGGRFPGGTGIKCTEIYEEGLRLPTVKLYKQGVPDDAIFQIVESNVRTPDEVVGDLKAQAAACQRGVHSFVLLIEKYGLETVRECNEQLRNYSEGLMRKGIVALADGEYSAEEIFEDDGVGGPGILLKVTVKIKGDQVCVDFAGTASQVKIAINVPFNLTAACVYITLISIFAGHAPINAGVLRPITVSAPVGSVLNPIFPSAVGARGMMMWRVIDLVYAAMAKAAPGKVFAGGEGGNNTVLFAPDKREGDRKMNTRDVFASGWGARPNQDGVEGVVPMSMGGLFHSISTEMLEQISPVVIEGVGFVADTGGAGKFRGALSLYRKYRFLSDGLIIVRNCRANSLPKGLAGGSDGTASRVTLTSDGVETALPLRTMVDMRVKAGDVLTFVQPGAAGYGNPAERAAHQIAEDILDEKISVAYARRVYNY